MFRQRNLLARFTPREGQLVLARGRVSLYEPRGEYQLLVEHLEDAGIGALQRAFEELRARLSAEGLFAAERKRALPTAPSRIGVITSPTGAAIRDILHVLALRFPAASVVIYPVPVQGAAAAPAIAAALDLACVRARVPGTDPGARWRIARGPVGLQRRARGARPGALHVAGRGRHRPRDRRHDCRFCRGRARADAHRRRTARGARPRVWLQRSHCWHAASSAAMLRKLGDVALHLRARQDRLQRAHPGARLIQHAQRLDELELRLRRALEAQLRTARTRMAGAGRARGQR